MENFLTFGLCFYLLCQAELTTLLFTSDRMVPYFFCRKMEKTRSRNGEKDGEVYLFRQSRRFRFIHNMIKVLSPICTFIWRVSNYASRQVKGINSRMELLLLLFIFVASWFCTHFVEITNCLFSMKPFPHNKRRSTFSL